MREYLQKQINTINSASNAYLFSQYIAGCCDCLATSELPIVLRQLQKSAVAQEYVECFSQPKVAILSNFTVDIFCEYLTLRGWVKQFNPSIDYPGYNQYAFAISDNNSSLYQSEPDYIVILLDETAICPLYTDRHHVLEQIKQFSVAQINLLKQLRQRSSAKIIMNTLCLTNLFLHSYIDHETRHRISLEINKLNQQLLQLALSANDMVVLDMTSILQDKTEKGLRDERLARYAHMQMSDDILHQLAAQTAQVIAAMQGYAKKCVVLDLDNTLWGGVLGDDGVQGIDLGQTPAGDEFKQLQQLLKHLKNQGVVLAINSKNEAKNVEMVFSYHDEMILTKDDLINIKANWQPKHVNMRDISSESNLSLEAMLFVDDSAAECALIQRFLPQVQTIRVQRGPIDVIEQIISAGYFDKSAASIEDATRTQMYRSEQERKTFLSSVDSLSDFLHELAIQVEVFMAQPSDLPRLHQMVLRTNQFNLTTQRYSVSQLQTFLEEKHRFAMLSRVHDRFGSYGIVGAALLSQEDHTMVINNLLLSCRVFSRGIEDVMLAEIVYLARAVQATQVKGHYIPSAKNVHVKDFYPAKGFIQMSDDAVGSVFTASVDLPLAYPAWLSVNSRVGSSGEGTIDAY